MFDKEIYYLWDDNELVMEHFFLELSTAAHLSALCKIF